MAVDAIDRAGGPARAVVFFKYDCAECRARVQIEEPNYLPERYRCPECGEWTQIEGAGFALSIGKHDAPPEKVLVVRPHYGRDD